MDDPIQAAPDGQLRPRRFTVRRLALIALVPLAIVAGGSGVYLVASGLPAAPPSTLPPGMTPSPLTGPSGPLPTAVAGASAPSSASGSSNPTGETAAPPTLLPPGTQPATDAPPSAAPPSATPAPTPVPTAPPPPPSIAPPPTAFVDQGTYRGDLRPATGDVALETLAKLAGPKSIVADASDLTFTSADTWITVSGVLGTDGAFTASGTGTYAGVPDVSVKFEGRITAQLLVGSYEIGADGGLPGGASITYQFAGARIDLPPQPMPEPISTFLVRYATALRTGDVETLEALLHPVVLARYGADQCRATLAASIADPTFAIEPTGVTGPGTWLYTADGAAIPVTDVYTVAASVTAIGATDRRYLHFGWFDGGLRWFTDCGTPIG